MSLLTCGDAGHDEHHHCYASIVVVYETGNECPLCEANRLLTEAQEHIKHLTAGRDRFLARVRELEAEARDGDA